jgi:hypothetical protein
MASKPLFSENVHVVAVGLWSPAHGAVWSSDRHIRQEDYVVVVPSVVYKKQAGNAIAFPADLAFCYKRQRQRRNKNELDSATVHRVHPKLGFKKRGFKKPLVGRS